MMRRSTIILALLGISAACHSTINESMSTENEQTVIIVNNRLYTEIPINNEPICNTGQIIGNCAQTVSLLQRRLMTLDPLPVPDFNQSTTVSWQQADESYKKFVYSQKGDPIVILFQQLYARILLNQYNIGTGDNYGLMQFYLGQMIDSQSLDFGTMTNTISRLTGKIPIDMYTQMLSSIVKSAEEQQIRQTETIVLIEKSIQSPTDKNTKTTGDFKAPFYDEAKKQTLAKLKGSNLTTYVNQLHTLQGSSAN